MTKIAASGRLGQEVLRLDGSTKGTFRLARRRAQIGDVTVEPGTIVMVMLSAINRDPRIFDNPVEFRIDRQNVRSHLAFGGGVHACIGAPLARAEARLTVEKLLARTGNIRIDDAVHGPQGARRFDYQANYTQRALSGLNIAFDRA